MAEYNFSDCKFDPTKFDGKKKVQDLYPELLPYTEFHGINHIDWKIAICISDIGSPFLKIKDEVQRLKEIFKYFSLDMKKESDRYNSVLNYRQSDIMDVCAFIIEYLNNNEFSKWWEYQQMLNKMLKRVNTPIKDGEDEERYYKSKFLLIKNIDEISETVKKIDTELFGTAAMKAAVYRSKKKLKRNYAEKYADENQVE